MLISSMILSPERKEWPMHFSFSGNIQHQLRQREKKCLAKRSPINAII
jgi:hypothetical protein